ncbi:MAG: hypothetical protein JOZ42_01575 [Acetobacteraceae bacterium]|nr:hypothetical protein [Acetobacteraceae bacterium]
MSVAVPRRIAPAPASAPEQYAVHRREWVDTILSRPLFSPTRRPPPAVASGASGPGDLARLTGVLVNRSEKRAIFAGEGGRQIVAEEGTRIGAYEVRTIEPGQVTVLGPDGQRTIRPAFDPKARDAGRPATPGRPVLAIPPRPSPANAGQPVIDQ